MTHTPIIECVPNFSEGRRPEVIEAIAQAIRQVEGVKLLDVDPGKATNRTVMTMAGAPERVIEAAFQAISMASSLIDMRTHTGEHPRMGATDVCPLIPVSGITMEETAAYAHQLAKRVGAELGIPVYMYESAATRPEQKIWLPSGPGSTRVLLRKWNSLTGNLIMGQQYSMKSQGQL